MLLPVRVGSGSWLLLDAQGVDCGGVDGRHSVDHALGDTGGDVRADFIRHALRGGMDIEGGMEAPPQI